MWHVIRKTEDGNGEVVFSHKSRKMAFKALNRLFDQYPDDWFYLRVE